MATTQEQFSNLKLIANHPELPKEVGDEDELLNVETFDLTSFFEKSQEERIDENIDDIQAIDAQKSLEPKEVNLLLSLRDDSGKLVQSFSTKVSAEAFNKTSSFMSGAALLMNSLLGSCGVICAHSLAALGQAGSGLPELPGLASGLNMSGFSVDDQGNFHLDGNIDTLSNTTGISKEDLLAGKFSADDILISYFSTFAEGVGILFGFGLVGKLFDCFFDSFLPKTIQTGELPLAA